jgi:hypothetical protein
LDEGKILGRQRGLDIGLELGYYIAFAAYWTSVIACAPSQVNARASKSLRALSTALEAFPDENRHDVDKLALLNKIRAKFKVAATVLGVAKMQSYTSSTSDATHANLTY